MNARSATGKRLQKNARKPHALQPWDGEAGRGLWLGALWLACSLAPAVAAPFLHLPQPFGDVLVDGSFVAGCVLMFLSSQESDEWARWRADYSRAIDQLLSAPSP